MICIGYFVIRDCYKRHTVKTNRHKNQYYLFRFSMQCFSIYSTIRTFESFPTMYAYLTDSPQSQSSIKVFHSCSTKIFCVEKLKRCTQNISYNCSFYCCCIVRHFIKKCGAHTQSYSPNVTTMKTTVIVVLLVFVVSVHSLNTSELNFRNCRPLHAPVSSVISLILYTIVHGLNSLI